MNFLFLLSLSFSIIPLYQIWIFSYIAMILFITNNILKGNKLYIPGIIYMLILTIYSLIISIYSTDIIQMQVVLCFLLSGFFLFMPSDIKERDVNLVIKLIVGMFFIQVVYYLFSHNAINIWGSLYRMKNIETTQGFTYIRGSGFFEEPSTYSAVLFALLIIKYKLKPYMDKIFIIAWLTLLLNLSALGTLLFLVIGLIILRKHIFTLVSISIILSPIILWILDSRLAGYDAIGSRLSFIIYIFEHNFLVGEGLGHIPKTGQYFVNDSGMIVALIYQLGIIGGMFISLLIYSYNAKYKNILILFMIASLLITKLPAYAPLAFFTLFCNLKESHS